jgi:hypothetical protein
MRSAISIWEYFASHAKKAFAVMYESEEVRIARKLLRWVERTGAIEFSERDAWKGIEGGVVKSMADIKTALKTLSERGYFRPLASENSRGKGRPRSPSYAVNPAWRTANIAKNQLGLASQDQHLPENAAVGEGAPRRTIPEVESRCLRTGASEGGETFEGGEPGVVAILNPSVWRCEVCEQPVLGDDYQTGLPWHESCRPEPTPEEFDVEYSEEAWA